MDDCSFKLSLPYNNEIDFIQKIVTPCRRYTREVYLPMHVSVCGSGRPWMRTDSRKAYYDTVEGLYEELRKRDIVLSIVGNNIEDESVWHRVVNEVLYLGERFPGSNFVLSSLHVAAHVHRMQPELELAPSTFCDVDSPAAARYWMELAGTRTVTVSRKINRCPESIRRIRGMGLKIRMVLNDDCIPSCPFVAFHRTCLAIGDRVRGITDKVDIDPLWRCQPMALRIKKERRWLLAQSNVLPGHLVHLNGLIDLAKIAGRDRTTDQLLHHIEAYVKMKSLEHSIGYREPPEAWEKIAACDRVCEACGWCEENIETLKNEELDEMDFDAI